jgi:carboxypeptidase Q
MKKVFIIIPLFLGGFLFSQKKPQKKPANKTGIAVKLNYHDEFKKISDEIMTSGRAYDNLGELTKGIGSRFSATPGYAKAVEWAEKKFKEIGIEMIWRQEAKAPVWIR